MVNEIMIKIVEEQLYKIELPHYETEAPQDTRNRNIRT